MYSVLRFIELIYPFGYLIDSNLGNNMGRKLLYILASNEKSIGGYIWRFLSNMLRKLLLGRQLGDDVDV